MDAGETYNPTKALAFASATKKANLTEGLAKTIVFYTVVEMIIINSLGTNVLFRVYFSFI